MIYIEVLEEAGLSAQDQAEMRPFLERAAETTLQMMQASGEISILLGSDATLQDLNSRFLGIDEPTDVLSFSDTEPDPETERTYWGDIAISYERAVAQAQAMGHSLEDEIMLLTVHGVLHLLGYDHYEADERERMWALQAQILERLGAGIRGPLDAAS
jgi:probable rRNA maturation factor